MSEKAQTPITPTPTPTSTTQPKKPKLDLKKANASQIHNMNMNMNIKNDKAEVIFSKERDKWSESLRPLYARLGNRNPSDYITIQSECLSIREQLQQSLAFHQTQLSKAQVTFKNAYGERMEFYMHGFGIKVNTGEKTKLVDRDLAEAKRRSELLEVHIDFLRECRYSCDQVQYAVKNFTALLEYIRMD
jgi:hypothetical protein